MRRTALPDKLGLMGALLAALVAAFSLGLATARNLRSAARGDEVSFGTRYHAETVPAPEDLGGGVAGRAQQVQTIITGVLIVIVASMAVVIVAAFSNSTSVNESDNPELASSMDSVMSGFASMLDLVEPLLLILIAVVIIGLIRRVQ